MKSRLKPSASGPLATGGGKNDQLAGRARVAEDEEENLRKAAPMEAVGIRIDCGQGDKTEILAESSGCSERNL